MSQWGGAKAKQVSKVDYSSYTGFPFYVMDYVPEWVGGVMTDYGASYKYMSKTEADEAGADVSEAVIVATNNGTQYYRWTTGGGWHQYFIAEDITTVVGGSYIVKALVKASANVTLNVDMRYGWSESPVSASVTIPQSDDFVEVVWVYNNAGGTNSWLVAQPGGSTAKIEWKSVTVYSADAEPYTAYGDLVEVTPTMSVLNHGGSIQAATPDEGVYTITDANENGMPWDTQFWIAAPYSLPAGQKFHVEFDYKATEASSVETQTHGENPGSYITWHCLGENVDFTTAWQTFSKDVTIANDMDGWQSIAFNMHVGSIVKVGDDDKYTGADMSYNLRNIKLKLPQELGERVDFVVGSSEWASFSSTKDVSLGTAKGYKAKYENGSVVLEAVTEVPKDEAVLIEGTGAYTFDVTTGVESLDGNELLVSDGNDEGDGSTIYTLANLAHGVGFYKVADGVKIPKGKAYMVITTSAPEFLGFDFGGTTSISEKTVVKSQAEGVYYNLAGQRVAQPTKGLYIVNGNKIVIK